MLECRPPEVLAPTALKPVALCRPLTPDCQPIIGATNCLGLFVNTGHSFNGWRQASLSAELLAKVVVAGSNSAMGEEAAALYSVERYGLDRPLVSADPARPEGQSILPDWLRSVLRVLVQFLP